MVQRSTVWNALHTTKLPGHPAQAHKAVPIRPAFICQQFAL